MSIYLDNAATTQIHPDVVAAMMPFYGNEFGNASGLYGHGRTARSAIDKARRQLAELVDCDESELIFTSGGTEANNSALLGAFLGASRRHIVTSAIEHHSVLETCEFLHTLGADITYVQPQQNGVLRVEDVLAAVTANTRLVSIMAVNNEIGTFQPVEAIARAVKELDSTILVHTDMVQALGAEPVHLRDSVVDFASFAAHKIHGPKGAGALFVRHGSSWRAILHGGSQERKRRAGTENVAGIVGFGAAAFRLHANFNDHLFHLRTIREQFLSGISQIPGCTLNSLETGALHIVNVRFHGVRSDALLMRLDLEGVEAAAGSACTAGSLEPSHVLAACGQGEPALGEAVRFSFSDFTTELDVREALQIVKDTVADLRNIQS